MQVRVLQQQSSEDKICLVSQHLDTCSGGGQILIGFGQVSAVESDRASSKSGWLCGLAVVFSLCGSHSQEKTCSKYLPGSDQSCPVPVGRQVATVTELPEAGPSRSHSAPDGEGDSRKMARKAFFSLLSP